MVHKKTVGDYFQAWREAYKKAYGKYPKVKVEEDAGYDEYLSEMETSG